MQAGDRESRSDMNSERLWIAWELLPLYYNLELNKNP